MKKMILLLAMLFCGISSGETFRDYHPKVAITFDSPFPATIFYGDTLTVLVRMSYFKLRDASAWTIPEGSILQNITSDCPNIPLAEIDKWSGTCLMHLTIPGDTLGKVIAGQLMYKVWGGEGFFPNRHDWNDTFLSYWFHVTVIPHYLSMASIPLQEATANLRFVHNLKSTVKFYDENTKAGKPVQVIVTPAELDGLHFDPASFSLTGTPNHIGTYSFRVSATNANGTAQATDLKIKVFPNSKDKPVFKQNYAMANALPEQKYTMNLLELIEPNPGFMVTNQVFFSLDPRAKNPSWLHISEEEATLLEGKVPLEVAGEEVEVTLIASSNTGGDSQPLLVKIPVLSDPTKKPVIKPFKLQKAAGSNLYEDLSSYITDPTNDSNRKVILTKVEPAAPFNISASNPTILEGTIPEDATGQKYLLTLRAHTSMGGSSDLVTVPLQISINKDLTPRFKRTDAMSRILYPGQPFLYDFVENNDIYPEYTDFPYEIQFAKGFTPPSWLRIEKNKLIADKVPEHVEPFTEIKLVIKNIPGGNSDDNLLSLIVMN